MRTADDGQKLCAGKAAASSRRCLTSALWVLASSCLFLGAAPAELVAQQTQGNWPRYGSWAASGGFRDSYAAQRPVRPPVRPPPSCPPPLCCRPPCCRPPGWCFDYVWSGPLWPPFYPVQPVIGWQPILVWGPLAGPLGAGPFGAGPFQAGINPPLVPLQPGLAGTGLRPVMPPAVPVPLRPLGNSVPAGPSSLMLGGGMDDSGGMDGRGGMDSTGSRRIGRREPPSSRPPALPMGLPAASGQSSGEPAAVSEVQRMHQQLAEQLQKIPNQPLGRTSARGPLPPERPSRQN